MTIFGADISRWQPAGIPARVANAGCDFLAMKATEGTSVDPTFAAKLAEVRGTPLLHWGYVFLDSRVSAQAHVDTVSRHVPKNLPLALDVEWRKDAQGRILSAPSLPLVWDVLRRLRAAGYHVAFTYFPRWYWEYLGKPPLLGLPPLWSSRYVDSPTTMREFRQGFGKVPSSFWDGYGGLSVEILQYTSSANIGGYQPLDADAYRGTRAGLSALLSPGVAPVTTGTPIVVLEG